MLKKNLGFSEMNKQIISILSIGGGPPNASGFNFLTPLVLDIFKSVLGICSSDQKEHFYETDEKIRTKQPAYV